MALLFSYGTLQQENVQLTLFARRLTGQPDQLPGFEQALVHIEDPNIVAASGMTHHPIVKFNGSTASRVPGTVFEISDAELKNVDSYESPAYKRVSVKLASGKQAWVYADIHSVP